MEQTYTLLPFSVEELYNVVILIVLLAISASVSGAEAACFSLSQNDMRSFRESNKSSDKSILKLFQSQDYLLATILIANNMVNIGAVLSANRIIDLTIQFGSVELEFVVKMVIVTFLLLLFGEIMPKIAATASPVNYVRSVTPFLSFLCKILRPFAYILVKGSSKISSSVPGKRSSISMDDLSQAIAITDDGNVEDKKMLSGIIRFVSTEVSQVMCPRIDTVAIEINDTFEQVQDVIVKSGFSRLPVYEGDKDNIKGIIYAKDLIAHLTDISFKWQTLIRPPYYVPEHKKINDLLEEFQTLKVHLAIVVDEYGAMEGIISLEDILEEIVGEISDESDKSKLPYTALSANCYLFDGKAHINDLLRLFELPDNHLDSVRGESETVAGLMLECKRDLLSVDDTITIKEFTLKVESITGRRADKIKITRNGASEHR